MKGLPGGEFVVLLEVDYLHAATSRQRHDINKFMEAVIKTYKTY
jgi:hypothetical protein